MADITRRTTVPLAWLLCVACGDDGGADSSTSDGEPTTTTTSTSTTASTGDDSSEEDTGDDASSSETSGGMACLEDPELGIGGEAIPIADMELRNAFDPTDRTVYDPDDPDALPGPLMFDTWGDRSNAAHGTVGVFPPGFSAPCTRIPAPTMAWCCAGR